MWCNTVHVRSVFQASTLAEFYRNLRSAFVTLKAVNEQDIAANVKHAMTTWGDASASPIQHNGRDRVRDIFTSRGYNSMAIRSAESYLWCTTLVFM